jgi:hypothetical protein
LRGSLKIQKAQKSIKITKDWENHPQTIIASTSYDTTYWITNKSKDGFTVNFSKAPSKEEELQWLVVF